jgi:poly(A) polymerase
MPHINLLYGFVPEAYFPEAAAAIAQALKQLEPFTITLSNFEIFTHSSSCTAWLNPIPEPADSLNRLQTVLQQIFPQCNEQSTRSANGFTPHLTAGQFATAQAAKTELSQWHPVQFQVDSIALISRRDNEPFQVRYRIPLKAENPPEISSAKAGEDGSNLSLIEIINQLDPKLTQTQLQHREAIQSIVVQACRECLGYPPLLQPIGSARMGVQSSHSDLDLICIIPAPLTGETFLKQVQNRLAGLCDRSQLVKSARVPVLRMAIEGVAVDLLSATTLGQSQIIEPLSEAARPFFDPVSWSAAVGILEADLIADTVSQHLSWDLFTNLLRAVRTWAKARQIHGNAWGFLGNFSWALLTAWTSIQCGDITPDSPRLFYSQENGGFVGAVSPCPPCPRDDKLLDILLAHFFQILSQHDWTQPIALTEAGKQYPVRKSREWFPVITSIEPCHNTTRNVARSTAEILRRELGRGAEIAEEVLAGNTAWATLFESADLPEQSNAFLVLTVSSAEVGELEKCGGWLEGNTIGLAINLEQKLNIHVRPWPGIRRRQNLVSAVLGTSCNIEEDSAAIALLSNEFIDQFHTVNDRSNILKVELCDRASLRNVLA